MRRSPGRPSASRSAPSAPQAASASGLLAMGVTGHTPGSVRAILDRHYLVRTGKAAERAFKARLEAERGGA